VQQFCDGLYGYDTVWSAKRIYFTPAEQLSVIMMSSKRQLVVKLTEEEEDFASDCSLPPVADYEENKTQEEEEVCLDERLVAAESSLRSDSIDAGTQPRSSVVYPVRSVVDHNLFQTTDHIRICYGYALQLDVSPAFDTPSQADSSSPAGPHLRRTWHIPEVGRLLPQ